MKLPKNFEKVILFDVHKIRKDFPILSRMVNNKPLIYFDNGATTQKPQQVIDALIKYYTVQNANIHRGVHRMSQDVTDEYENARITVQKHIGAKQEHEIIFTSGTTDSINFIATAFGKKYVNAGDEIVVSEMEHHSNILPWQQLCEEKNAVLKVIPITDSGELCMDEYKKLLSAKTKLIAITHVSNTLGTVNPVKEMIAIAHSKNIPVLVDGAQSIPHIKVDVQDLDADFYCFSGHKVYAPTGVGILYGKEEWLNKLPNYQVGGGTIKTVSFDKSEYAESPLRFEAGTPNIEGGIGLAVALDYINVLGLENIATYEHELLGYATEKLSAIDNLRIIGTAKEKASVISFVVDGIHPLDLGMLLDAQGIAVRTGHHCTQPLMAHYQIPGTVRASFSFYNTKEEIDVFANAIVKSIKRINQK
ncbi:cysteine desulfurase [Flavobacterium sp. GSP27]|uniref:aminotransferase class V-fold PLP-dependent enzyme n=1 Tax=Flavobacterium sp. GSP27 TaxID=2497489 RepID=UPI000F82DBDD|nr:cysteine desulfurase [Flavobacterium sp. GSP27]RTY94743.1 cysteine desulfurase [Flavobacterium sp. GSN2]RTZ09920.1 cysteine desulfurase [Flavobacterium sp. GSP27]